MPPRDPLTFPGGWIRLDNLKEALEEESKNPPIGITQGGSSRKDGGARPAARDSNVQKRRRKK